MTLTLTLRELLYLNNLLLVQKKKGEQYVKRVSKKYHNGVLHFNEDHPISTLYEKVRNLKAAEGVI